MKQKKSFWLTLPGILTGIAAVITAVSGLILGLYQVGIIGKANNGIDEFQRYKVVISIDGNGTTNPNPGSQVFDAGTLVTITTVPSSGWEFDRWSGDFFGSSPVLSITIDSDKNITAHFKPESVSTLAQTQTMTPVQTSTQTPAPTSTSTSTPTQTPPLTTSLVLGNVEVKGNILFNDLSITNFTTIEPKIWVIGGAPEYDRIPIESNYERTTGEYLLSGLPEGDCTIYAYIDAALPFNGITYFGGDFNGWESVRINPGQTVLQKDIHLTQNIHLLLPVDNQETQEYYIIDWGIPEFFNDVYAPGEIHFVWDSVPGANEYKVIIKKYQKGTLRAELVETIVFVTVSSTEYSPAPLPITEPNQFYSFYLNAYCQGERIGELRIWMESADPVITASSGEYQFKIE